MKKKIKVTLPYVKDDGTDAEYKFEIKFISQRMIHNYTELNRTIKKVETSSMNLAIAKNKLETDSSLPKEKQIELMKIINTESDEIIKLTGMDYFNKRFDLIKDLLTRNGYKETEPFMSFDFWDLNVEPSEINEFLKTCMFKDIEPGKKQ